MVFKTLVNPTFFSLFFFQLYNKENFKFSEQQYTFYKKSAHTKDNGITGVIL